jgi:hypothetical protein
LLKRHGLALLLYLALLVASFLPLSLRPWDTIAYVGDSLESVYLVAWNVHQAFRSPLHLFDANVLYPHRQALAFTDHRLLPSLLVAPVIWATGNPVLATNLAVGLACLLAAFAGRRLCALLGADAVGAWAGGALYAFHTYQINEAPRLNIVFHGFLALALAELLLYLRRGEPRRAWTTAGCLLLQGLSSNYHLLYGALLVGLVVGLALAARPRHTLRLLPRLALAGGLAAVLFAPIAAVYVAQARSQGYARELPQGIDLVHYVSTAPGNVIYGSIGVETRLQQRGPHFAGFVSLALGALCVGLALTRRLSGDGLLPARGAALGAAGLALLFVALSLGADLVAFGQELGPGPYRLLWRFVPGFRLVRIPERLGLLAMLFLAVLVALALTWLAARGRTRLALLLAALVPLEHLSQLSVHEQVPVGKRVPEVYRWLAGQPVAALAEMPARGEGLVRRETLEMYFSTFHWWRTIHGYTAYPPPLTRALRREADRFPAPGALAALDRVGVDTVIVHRGRPGAVDLRQKLEDAGLDEGRLPGLLAAAELDLTAGLGRALAQGSIRGLARFAAGEEGGADEVYRIVRAPRIEPAAQPRGPRVLDPAWRYRAKVGEPGLAADGLLATTWRVDRRLRGDEFWEVIFDRPVRVGGVRLRLRRDSAFPTAFRIAGRDLQGRWIELARLDDPHRLQWLDELRSGAAEPGLGFSLGGVELLGLQLLVADEGTSFDGWSIPEIEVLAP